MCVCLWVSASQGDRFKMKDDFAFPVTLDMAPYMEENISSSDPSSMEPILYDLYSVIVHAGGAHGRSHHYCFSAMPLLTIAFFRRCSIFLSSSNHVVFSVLFELLANSL